MLANGGVVRQGLLIPAIVELGDEEAAALAEQAGELAALGLVIEPFGAGAVAVREVPALLGDTDVEGLVRDLAAESPPRATALAADATASKPCARAWPVTAASAPAAA